MKKLILILFAMTLLLGCEEKSRIEVIQNYSVKYIEEAKVTKQVKPEIEDFEKYITDEFQTIIQEINDETDGKYLLFPVGYNLFVNENGRIDKIAKIEAIEIEPKGKHIFNNSNKLMDEITLKILPKMEKWKFAPAKLFNKNIAMQKSIKALFANMGNGEIVLKKPFSLSFNNALNDFFVAVEKMPSPIGGMKAIQRNITYPEIAKRAGIEGRVYVKAYIDSTGTVAKTEIIRGIGAGCDEMAMEAVRKVKFTPGMQRGKRVNVQVTVPILFKLGDSQKNSNKNDSKIVGNWEGKADDGEVIKITFLSNGDTELYKSKSGRMNGEVTGATFWPKYKINYSISPYSLDLFFKSKNKESVQKLLVKFSSNHDIVLGLPKELNVRPKNFNTNNVSGIWELKRVK